MKTIELEGISRGTELTFLPDNKIIAVGYNSITEFEYNSASGKFEIVQYYKNQSEILNIIDYKLTTNGDFLYTLSEETLKA